MKTVGRQMRCRSEWNHLNQQWWWFWSPPVTTTLVFDLTILFLKKCSATYFTLNAVQFPRFIFSILDVNQTEWNAIFKEEEDIGKQKEIDIIWSKLFIERRDKHMLIKILLVQLLTTIWLGVGWLYLYMITKILYKVLLPAPKHSDPMI